MPFNFDNIPDPFDYLESPSRFVEFICQFTRRLSPIHKRLAIYYTDEEIDVVVVTRDTGTDGRVRVTGQESGLPARIVGRSFGLLLNERNENVTNSNNLERLRKEPVTENQIGWRVDILGDFMYGEDDDESRTFIKSDLPEENPLKQEIEDLLAAVVDGQDDPTWFHSFYSVGAIHGYTDVVLRMDEAVTIEKNKETDEIVRWLIDDEAFRPKDYEQFGRALQWHIASPLEVVPLVDPRIRNKLWGWVLHYRTEIMPGAEVSDNVKIEDKQKIDWIELYVRGLIQVYKLDPRRGKNYVLVDEFPVPENLLPVTHMQHLKRRDKYRGVGEVEPLIPMQDELNTRLSDRGRGITFGANPPWLGKGISNFETLPFGPDVKYSGSEDASMERLAGDTKDDGQDNHIEEARNAIDRISSIPPLASGDIKDQIGNLSSAVALRVVLRGMLAKLSRIRMNHSRAIQKIAFDTLAYANATGTLKTEPDERKVHIEWPASVEESLLERLEIAQLKKAIGVPDRQLQVELDYTDEEADAFEKLNRENNRDVFGSMSDNEDDDT